MSLSKSQRKAIEEVRKLGEYDDDQFRRKKLGLPYDKIIDIVY